MRRAACLWLAAFSLAAAQNPAPSPHAHKSSSASHSGSPHAKAPASADASSSTPAWRRWMMSLPDRPAASAGVSDIDRFTANVQLAAPYFGALTPGDYEANRALVRRMWAYYLSLDALAGSPQAQPSADLRQAVDRARLALDSLPAAFLAIRQLSPDGAPGLASSAQPAPPPAAPAPGPAPGPDDPPFAMRAPDLGNLAPADRKLAQELSSRYEIAAADASGAWQSAESVRRSLAAQNLVLNNQTATSLIRLQLYFEQAAAALRQHDWEQARTSIQRAEYETGKVLKSLGG